MNPMPHFVASVLLSIVLFPFYSYWSFLALLSGWLIDVDHVFYWGFKFKEWNVFKIYRANIESHNLRLKNMFHLFHTAEMWGLFLIFGLLFFAKDYGFVFFPLLGGLVLHLWLDYYWWFSKDHKKERANSLIEHFMRKSQ